MKVVVTGVPELEARLAAAPEKALVALSRGLYEIGNEILAEANNLVPVDTGDLRSSGDVSTPEFNGMTVSVEIGYGGSAIGYAIFVHEIPPPPQKSPKGRSATHRPPTQWKFLETPVMDHATRFGSELDERVAKILQL